MAVYRKKQPARRPVRRGWKRHARTGMFLFAFALVAVTVGVILPHAGVMSAAAEGSTLTEKIFTTVQNKNLPVIAIDPGHGGTDPGSEGSGLWEYEMTWQVANELVNLLEQDGRYAPVLTITEEESQNSDMPRVEPAERAQRANDAGAVLLFSIHGNSDPSGTASGFECYAIPPGQQYHDESESPSGSQNMGMTVAPSLVRMSAQISPPAPLPPSSTTLTGRASLKRLRISCLYVGMMSMREAVPVPSAKAPSSKMALIFWISSP